MNSDKIYKLCCIFKFAIEKRSDVASDLATRIMHSLVPTSGHPEEDRQKLTHLVSVHLIGVAERYIDNAIKIILDELRYSSNTEISGIGYAEFPKERYLDILNLSIESFMDPNQWEIKFGGKKWAVFSQRVIDLYNSINKFKKAKETNNVKIMNEQSGMISVYLNVLDGMSHNSDSFLNRIINQEIAEETMGKYDNETYELSKQKEKEIIDLMDSKELHNKQDVIPFIRKKIYDNPESYLYREHLRNIYMPQEKSNPEQLQKEMEIIREKKIIINYVNNFVDSLIDEIEIGIKDGENAEFYLSKFNKIINFYKFRSIKNDLLKITNKHNIEGIYGMLNATEEIREFILNNIELILNNSIYKGDGQW